MFTQRREGAKKSNPPCNLLCAFAPLREIFLSKIYL